MKHIVEAQTALIFPQQIHTRQTRKYSKVNDYCQSIKSGPDKQKVSLDDHPSNKTAFLKKIKKTTKHNYSICKAQAVPGVLYSMFSLRFFK